jgi:hypothetical protein
MACTVVTGVLLVCNGLNARLGAPSVAAAEEIITARLAGLGRLSLRRA